MAAVAPGVVVLAGIPVLGGFEGAFEVSTWSLAALFVLALLVVALLVGGVPPSPHPWRMVLWAYGGLCAWSGLSVLWADVPGEAWHGANRTVFYGLVLGVVGLRPWRRGAAAAGAGILVFGVASLAAGTLAATALGADPMRLFIDGRLAEPTGYANATADLWLLAFWPALALAAGSPEVPRALRALALGGASLLLETAVLSQSRGAAVALVVSAVVYLWLTRARLVATASLACVATLAAVAWAPLTAVRAAPGSAALADALATARVVIVATTIVAICCGFALTARVPVVPRPWSTRRGTRLAARGAAVAGVLALTVAVGDPAVWASHRWADFKTSGYAGVEAGHTRFSGSLGSNRYDFYRVAWGEFTRHPLTGIGQDNFAVPYLEHRRSPEAPRYPHSLALGVLSQLGLVGALLLGAFIVLAVRCATLAARRSESFVAAGALAGFCLWLCHAAVDWLWEFPAPAAGALALLALAARSGDSRATDAVSDAGRRIALPGRARSGFVAIAAVPLALSLAAPGVASRLTRSAAAAAATNPDAAFADLDLAARLDVLSARPLVVKGVIARRAGRIAEARDALERAAAREPRNWFVHLELAFLDAQRGSRRAALGHLKTAARLDPGQKLIATVRRRVRTGRGVQPSRVERELYDQLKWKLHATSRRSMR
jgi:hypothetical protein